MRTETDQTIYLKDYAPSPYLIERVELDVRFEESETRVRALLTILPNRDTEPGTPLVLDGDELTLDTIAIDGLPLVLSAYAATPDALTLMEPPHRRFVLETEVRLTPETNTRLMGLYRSNGVWCTQCEPEGFRRITYFLDRPDILSTYKVTMTADRALAPILLSNGNPSGGGDAGDGRHYAVWEDPFPKPAYLFALVAGDLAAIHDSFTTASGRKVALAIYCEHGKQEQCAYAMDALKRSMAWDERRFGLEYDLDVFNIVAVSDFNFGAMENKGLNIFNDKLVFARPETATDVDYAGIESVIAHEYFHNWTGNRITCRDWFQLCLKEGLTVYRDQEFTMDERSRPVARIEDVRKLRATQFPEDGGPLAHPARPDNYREINNFYTATVYEKGAEIVRMLATLLGEAGFRKGMDLYFERHDGDATTIEAFIAVFAEASGRDLSQFEQWYLQAGTPDLEVGETWDEATRRYSLSFRQRTRPTPGQPEKAPMVIPVRFGLVGPNGSDMGWSGVSGGRVESDLIVLEDGETTITFEGVASRPVPSLLRGFSAPVNLTSSLGQAEKLFLARHDADPFNRWQALQDVAMKLIIDAVDGAALSTADADAFTDALVETLGAEGLDDAFKAHALTLPAETDIARIIGKSVDPDAIHAARQSLIAAISERAGHALGEAYDARSADTPYSPGAAEAGRRALRNTVLGLLVRGGAPGAAARATTQYHEAGNMTDRLAALSSAVAAWTGDAQALLEDFRTHHTADPLVYDKWLAANAIAPHGGTLERLRAILADPDFPRNNPNRLRALVGSFANANPTQFGRADGAGFRFVTDFVADVDRRNPNVAARVLTAFRVWRTYEPGRREAAERALRGLAEAGGLSRNTADILARTLDTASG
ncbi:aminopeptidase N [Arsenicitalea aurantiaca]|uniref:Aminopeptidase N n=1 Tax=Arsenicitalea aurantiaca TaxID=1783274 RepID=A0A433XA57_9HYPH|nr:aminopeptidase N [Arsenicitalea aurantiaca]RUT30971.1 aminopeptidase N [Arsenicitalea aurantiaca]